MTRNKIRAAIVAVAFTLGALAFAAPSAFASTCDPNCSAPGNTTVTATGSVASSISFTGLTASVPFGPLSLSVTNQVMSAETYNVTTNDPAGYTLSITPTGTAFTGSINPANTIPDAGTGSPSNFRIGEHNAGTGGSLIGFATPGPVTIDQVTTTANKTYIEDWYLQVPASTQPDTYSQQFTYLALAS